MRPDEPILTKPFRKNVAEERFLERLNEVLTPFEEETYREVEETLPNVYIIGAPRSGTTLLVQLLCTHLNVGTINNLIAAFWKAPTVGIRLSKKLFPQGLQSSYNSELGQTKGIMEPHEFGYFWLTLLGYPELAYQGKDFEGTIDWQHVKAVITNMTAVYGYPIIFKTLWMIWHMKKLQEILPKSCFVFIRRNPLHNALSILDYRRRFLGSVEDWVSMKPPEYANLKTEPYWKQAVGQVYYLEKAIKRGKEQINGRNFVELGYEDLCCNPKAELSKVVKLLRDNGAETRFVSEPPESFQSSMRKSESKEEQRLVEKAVQDLYGG